MSSKNTSSANLNEPIFTEELNRKYFFSGTGFSDWKEDLFEFVSDDFVKKWSFGNETEKYTASQKVDSWMYVTTLSTIYDINWWRDEDGKKESIDTLTKVLEIAEEKKIGRIIRGINRILTRVA